MSVAENSEVHPSRTAGRRIDQSLANVQSVAALALAVNWRWLLLASAISLALLINLVLVFRTVTYWHGPAWGESNDWNELIQAATSPNPYLADGYRWSPVAAWLLAGVLPMGIGAWRALHFVALLAIRDWRVIGLVLISWPFWEDTVGANVVVFAVVAAWTAMNGSRIGAVVFLALVVLMPRPLFAPAVIWLLWKQPWTRYAATALLLVHAGLVMTSGLGGDWVSRLLSTGQAEMAHRLNIAPSHWIGAIWIPVGLALSAILLFRKHVGLASLAASPYLFGYYGLVALLEFAPRPKHLESSSDSNAFPTSPTRRRRFTQDLPLCSRWRRHQPSAQ